MTENIIEKSNYKKQYISIFICWLAYTSVYFGRYTYSANIALIEDYYQKSHSEAGLVMTFFSIAYGSCQFLHGFLCKKYPKRIVVSFALIVAAIMDFLIFSGVPFYLIKYLWLFSAICQSALWPVMLQVISENVDEKLINKAVLAMSTTTAVGTLFVYGSSAAFARYNFKYTFLFGSLLLIGVAVVWFLFYEQGNFLNKADEISDNKENTKTQKKLIYILMPIFLLIIFSIITNFIKDGLQTWVPVILKSFHGMKDSLSIVLTIVLPVFGIFGSYFAVFMSGKIKKTILLVMFFFVIISLFEIIVIFFKSNLLIMLFSFGVLELLLHGACSIITSIFPLAMRKEISSGYLAGILNGSAYIGSAASSYVLGKIADISGWTAVFVTFLGVVLSVLTFGVIYWIVALKKPELKV